MKAQKRGYSLLFLFCVLGIALGVAQAYAQSKKVNPASPASRSTASLTQGPWMKSKTSEPARIKLAPPLASGAQPAAIGLQNPRSPASRAQPTGEAAAGAQPSQVFPAGGAGNSW